MGKYFYILKQIVLRILSAIKLVLWVDNIDHEI